jgi:hypothetical protein
MKHVQRFKTRVFRRTASPAKSALENPSPSTNTPEPESQSSSVYLTEPTEPRGEKRGLFKLADSQPDSSGSKNYEVDIIAVHGLNGDAFSTWRHQPDGTLWLRDLLPEFLPGCRVYTYGYPSKIFSESSARVQEYARNLVVSLRDIREDSTIVLSPASPILVMSDTSARANVLSSLYAIALVELFLNRFVCLMSVEQKTDLN